jgi:hypothetical protein
MKTNELRIGNWVNFIPDNGNFIISDIKTFNENTINGLELEDCQPIPLTKEWLYKFGFKNIDKGDNDYITYTDSNHDYYLQLDVRKKDGKYSILDNSFDDLRDFSMIDISYVHQLQNLYFALTGEELQYIGL